MTTEIFNPDIKRVDAVDGPATGAPFLILKSQDAPVSKADGDHDEADADAADAVLGDDEPLPTADELDATTVADADGMGVPTDAPGDPDNTESAAWEAVDAARGRQMLQLTIALQRMVSLAADREAQEAALSDDFDDHANVWTLEEVDDALDGILSLLAPFALTEQAEADQRTADSAFAVLNKALTRPAREDNTVDTEPTKPVAKADDTAMVAVFDAEGNLIGSVDPDDITMLSGVAAPAADDDSDGTDADDTADAADAAPTDAADAAPVAAATDAAPANVADAPEPAAPVAAPVAAPAPTDEENVAKSLDDRVAEAVAKALESAVAAAVEPLVKSNEDLVTRLQKMEQAPRAGGPLLSGQTPTVSGPALRGHADEAQMQLRKELADEADPGARVMGVANLIKNGWQEHQ